MRTVKGEVVLAMDYDEARGLRDALETLGDWFDRADAGNWFQRPEADRDVDGDHPLVGTLEPRMRLSILLEEIKRNVR